MPIESVMPSNQLILCHPLLLLPSISPSIRNFSKKSTLHIRWCLTQNFDCWRISLTFSYWTRRPGFDPWISKISWNKKGQPIPTFLPGESHGQRSLSGSSHEAAESNMTEWLTLIHWISRREIRRCLLLGRKAMSNLDSILKRRDITLPTKIGIVKAVVSPVVMYGCESWTMKKAEHRRTDAFILWCWRTLFRVPWTARRSNQSILKEISPEYSLEGLMLKQLQSFGHLMWRTGWLEKTLMLGKIEGRRRSKWQRMRWLDGITDSRHTNLSKLQEALKDRGAWRAIVLGVAKSWHDLATEQQQQRLNQCEFVFAYL